MSQGPAPESVTNKIYELSTSISEYHICPDVKPDITAIGTHEFTVNGKIFTVEVIDSVKDYADYMREIFDFNGIKKLVAGSDGKAGLKVLANCMHGGQYTDC